MFSATRNESEVQTDGRDILRSQNFEVRKCEKSLDLEKDEDVLERHTLGVGRQAGTCRLGKSPLSIQMCQLAMITAGRIAK